MGNSNNNNNPSNQIVDMLVDTILKKHDVKLDEVKLDSSQKTQLKNLVESLSQSVDGLAQENKAKEENGAKKNDTTNKSN